MIKVLKVIGIGIGMSTLIYFLIALGRYDLVWMEDAKVDNRIGFMILSALSFIAPGAYYFIPEDKEGEQDDTVSSA